MIYPLTILFTLCFVFYSKYQFEDVREGWERAKGKWHPYGAVMRALPFAIAFIETDWKDVVLAGVISIIIFEIGINVIALKKEWNYVGSTAKSDRMFGKYKWYGMVALLIAAVVIRVV